MLDYGRILITGGTGALGKALLQYERETGRHSQIVILSRDPVRQHEIRQEFQDLNLYFVTGDVADAESVAFAMQGCDLVIHAAAMKHIPEGERDPIFAVQSNVNGSMVVAHMAAQLGVEKVIGISTDKACQPLNAYGATKLLMEKTFQSYDGISQTQFHLVRYGNVIGSTGSVVRVWREMEQRDGVVHATAPFMRRFWLTTAMAIQFIEIALGEERGTIVVPKLKALRMDQMAKYVLKPETKVVYDGRRPGEKDDEIMISPEEMFHTIDIPEKSIYQIWPPGFKCSPDLPPFFGTANAELLTKEEFDEMFGAL